MGKLLTGHYGEPPEAESVPLALKDCYQRLNLKPSDFISVGLPDFFNKAYGAKGRYLVFEVEAAEVGNNPIWKAGYYLLPISAMDVLRSLDRSQRKEATAGTRVLPVEIESKDTVPPQIMENAQRWANECQPLFFKCRCDHLILKLTAPWAMRNRWKARVSCPDKCQPTLTKEL